MQRIVFIHGNSSSARILEPVKKIWKKPKQIIGIELPGHGNSERLEDYSWSAMRNYLKEKVNNIDGEKILIGHSLGGHYAIEIAPQIED